MNKKKYKKILDKWKDVKIILPESYNEIRIDFLGEPNHYLIHYNKDNINCLYYKHPKYFFKPTFYPNLLLFGDIINFIKELNFKGKIGFEKINYDGLNKFVKILLKRNNIQFQENEKYIYTEVF